jgi:hypothetical protein
MRRSTKIHAITDEKCRLHGFSLPFVTACARQAYGGGQVHDLKPAPQLIRQFPKLRKLLADKDYNANYIDAYCSVRAIEVVIPPKSNAKNPCKYKKLTYKNATP